MLVPENVELNSETLSDFGSGSFMEYAYKLLWCAPSDVVTLFLARVPVSYARACSTAGYSPDETVRLWKDGVLEEYL